VSRGCRRSAASQFVLSVVALSMFPAFLTAQKWWDAKPYEEWSPAEVNELLHHSPWVKYCAAGRVVTAVQRTNVAGNPNWGARTYSGFYVLRLLTARPVREASLRQLSFSELGLAVDAKSLAGEGTQEARLDRLQGYIRSHPDGLLVQGDPEHIILCISWSVGNESAPGSRIDHLQQQEMPLPENVRRLQLSDLAPVSLLSTDGKKKVLLVRFDVEDPMIAKFYFPRMTADGKLLIADGDKKLRFESRIGKIKIVAEFQVPTLLWKGRLEF